MPRSSPADLSPPAIDRRDERPTKPKRGSSARLPAMRLRLANPAYLRATTSKAAQAVVKVGSYAAGYRISQLLNYIARAHRDEREQVEVLGPHGEKLLGLGDIQTIYQEWRQDHVDDRAKAPGRPRHVAHVILSASAELTDANLRSTLAAAQATLQECVGSRGYSYVLAPHRDGGRPHVHAVIRLKSMKPGGKKLRLNPAELFELRSVFAEQLRERGLEHVATLRRDRPYIMDRVQAGVEALKKRETQFQRNMAKREPSVNALAYRRSVERELCRLREEIKKDTFPLVDPRRGNMLAVVRDLERGMAARQPDMPRLLEATVRRFGQDASRYAVALNRLTNPPTGSEPLTAERRAWKETVLSSLAEKTGTDIERAREFVQTAKELPAEVKQATLAALDNHAEALRSKTPAEKQALRQVDGLVKEINNWYGEAAGLEKRHEAEKRSGHPRTGRDRMRDRLALEKQAERLDRAALEVRRVVRASGLPKPARTEMLQALRLARKTLDLGQEKHLGLSRGLAP